jgi:hypothetical protein
MTQGLQHERPTTTENADPNRWLGQAQDLTTVFHCHGLSYYVVSG